jgi:hypothetical protein
MAERSYGVGAWGQVRSGRWIMREQQYGMPYNHLQTRGRRASGAGYETFARLKWSSFHADGCQMR